SKVTWIGSKPTGKHDGAIPVVEGTISVEDGTITAGSFSMDIANITIADIEEDTEEYGKLKGHLLSEDFFAAEEYPTATFEITAITSFDSTVINTKEEYETDFAPASGNEHIVTNPTHNISGNLTMRGATKNITFPANVSISGDKITAKAKFNIDRTDWKLMYGDEASVTDKAKDKFIYNTVNVGFEIEASSQATL
ncbi:MAG: YceI family protein, partial [Bacteroidota bacterium]